MRKGSFFIFFFATGFLASAVFLFLIQEAWAIKFPMPDVGGQFKKQDLKTGAPMQIQADQVSFDSSDNEGIAKGNVVVRSGDQLLYCDQLQIYRIIQQAVGQGHVYLDTPQEQVIAQGFTYNFNEHTGEFRDARIFADPYQIKGKAISKVSENHMTMDEGYLTTSDWDQPDYRISGRRMDVYLKDKATMHDMKVYLGKVPVMYLPYYVQDLKNRPVFTFIPGHKKEFGMFLLSTLRFQAGPNIKIAVHADVRERTGFGEGFDIMYNTPNFGKGILTAYYTDENKIASHHLWGMYNSDGSKKGPTTHHERYRIRWRHKWQIDKNTEAIWQIYKIHDYDIVNNGFLKDYFQREYNTNADVTNYFLLTRVMPHGTLTFDVTDSRINRPLRSVDRFPEIAYTLNNTQIGKTGVYVKSTDTYSNLSDQDYPKTFNHKAERFDTNNDISRPFKIGFIQFNPHIGGEGTYYTRTIYPFKKDIVRGLLRTSLDMSTKFYKVWDYHTNFAGLNINGLRHVVTPTITYLYQARPSCPAALLNQFDPSIDDLYRIHQLEFGLENKLQTKRNGQVVDLARILLTTNFGLKRTTGRLGFNPYDLKVDINPNDWLTFHSDGEYDFHLDHFNSENFSGEVHGDNWSFALGNLYTRTQSDQLTTEFRYRLNPKWAFRLFNTFPVTKAENGVVYSQANINAISNYDGIVTTSNNLTSARESQFVITRDLHEWEVDFSVDAVQKQGVTFYVVFRLKAFPNMKLNLANTTFPDSKPGSQALTGAE